VHTVAGRFVISAPSNLALRATERIASCVPATEHSAGSPDAGERNPSRWSLRRLAGIRSSPRKPRFSALGARETSIVLTFGFLLSITLIQPSSKQAMKEIPICTTLVYRVAQPKMIPSTARILVANNEPQVRTLFARKLKLAGYAVSEAGSGRKTLDLLRGARFDVLVLDLDIPGADSFEVLKIVRSDMPHLRVLVISAKRELLEAAEWFGAVAAIDKVSAPDRLLTTVRLLLGDSSGAKSCGTRPGS